MAKKDAARTKRDKVTTARGSATAIGAAASATKRHNGAKVGRAVVAAAALQQADFVAAVRDIVACSALQARRALGQTKSDDVGKAVQALLAGEAVLRATRARVEAMMDSGVVPSDAKLTAMMRALARAAASPRTAGRNRRQ